MDGSQHVVELVDDHAAQIVLDETGGVRAARADDLLHEELRVAHPYRVAAERAQSHHAKVGVTKDDRLRGSPAEIGELAQRDEIDLGRERRRAAEGNPHDA